MLTDPISDFLTRIRNSSRARQKYCIAKSSQMIKAIAKVLAENHFIESFYCEGEGCVKEIKVALRQDRNPLELKRISKPGQRIYLGQEEIKRVRNGFGIGIYSTSKGILSDKQAREMKIGGEYICEIY